MLCLLEVAVFAGLSGASAEPPPVDASVVKWRQAARDRPDNVEVWNALGTALMQQSRSRFDPALYDEAEAAFRQVLSLNARETYAMTGLAWVYNSRHAFDEGTAWAQKALEIDDRIQHAHALLGDAAVERGDYDEAFDRYQSALDIRPDLASYARAAHLLFLTGDSSRACWMMEKAVKAGGPRPENLAWCRAELAMMLFKTGGLLPAERLLASALKESPDNRQLLQAMARVKTARNDFDAAVACYERLLQQEGAEYSHPQSLIEFGDLHRLEGRRAEAEKLYERFVGVCRDGAHGHSHPVSGPVPAHSHASENILLAQFFADRGEHLGEALKMAREASRSYPNVFVLDTLAWCYYKTGDLDRARRTIRKALRWKTPEARMLFHAGVIHAELGERPEAKRHLHAALNLNPVFHPFDAKTAVETLRRLSASQGSGEPEADQ